MDLARWKSEQLRVEGLPIFVPLQPRSKGKLVLWRRMLRSARRMAEGGVVSPLGVVLPLCPTSNRQTAAYREWYRWYSLAWRKTRAPRFRLVKRRPWERSYAGIHHTPKPQLLDVFAMRAAGYSVRDVGRALGLSVAAAHALVVRARAEAKRPVTYKLMKLQDRIQRRMEAT